MAKRKKRSTKAVTEAMERRSLSMDWSSRAKLDTGSTVLNLACSGDPFGGFPLGSYVFLVGDSMSGKTWFSMTCLAEASRDRRFKDHRFIYDGPEWGAGMDLERYFGRRMAERLEPPAVDSEGRPQFSRFVEEFYFGLDDDLSSGRPFIRILDSMDALDAFDDEQKFQEWKAASREGKAASGSYGMAKAKLNSTSLRKTAARLQETDSILIVISQTRDNVDTKNPFGGKTRSGGRALRFYSTLEIWTSVVGPIKRTYKKKPVSIGATIGIDVKKNRLIGKQSKVQVPIYYSHGIDDIGSCVDFLLDWNLWKKTGNTVVAEGLGPTIQQSREKLIQTIEERDLVDDLRYLVGESWREIEEAVAVQRKRRYE